VDAQTTSALPSALNEEEARLALVITAAEIGIWDWDLQSNAMRYSPRAREICGFSQEGVVTYEMVRDVTHPDDLPRTSALAREATDPAKRARPVFHYRIRRTDGEIRWVVAHGEALFDGPGPKARALRYLGTLQDITETKTAQDALAASEASLRLALNAGQLAVWNFDVATSTVGGSPELYQLLGYPPGVTPTLDELRANYVADDRQLVLKAAEKALAEGKRNFEARYRYQVPGQALKWLHLRAEIQFDASDRPIAAIGVVADITHQKEAELEKEDALARLVAALEASTTGTWRWTVGNNRVEWDQALCRVYGIAVEDSPRDAEQFMTFVHPDDRQKTGALIATALQGKRELEHEFRIIRNGETRWIYDRSKPVLDHNGDVLAFIGACTDVTERKRYEERLKASEQRLRRAHEVARLGDFEVEISSGAITASESLYHLMGWDPHDASLRQAKILDMVHPDDRAKVRAQLQQGLQGEPIQFEFRARHADGSYRWLACRAERQIDDRGRPLRLIGVNFDVTEMREAQLSQERLIHELNHRVKNTLTTVQSLAHMSFKSAGEKLPELRAFLNRLFALSVTHSLLMQSLWESVELHDLILGELKPYLGPRVEIIRGPSVLLGPAAAVSLGMAVHELATNAAKYGALHGEDRKLVISWERSGGDVTLRWRETGISVFSGKPGFGTKLIESIVQNDLKGTVERTFHAGGFEVVIRFAEETATPPPKPTL
jgi:PAS domain S-box-containing protein